MAKKITIQHLYTTGTTAAPAASALTLGEIAISAGKNKEGIYFKNSDNEVIGVLTSGQTYELVEKATSGITTDGAFQMHREKFASEYNDENKIDVNKYGHVLLHNGDLNGIDSVPGVAAGMGHTHGQYLTGVTAGSGLAIVGIIENGEVELQLDSETNNKINSGVTAYDWGNHADEGYAKNNDLTTLRNSVTAHTGNTTVHITAAERSDWNTAANRINTFLDVETGATEALDSLHEIQEYLTGSGNSVNTLLESLNNLTDTVSGNTDDITSLKQNFEENGTVPILQNDVQRKIEAIDVSGNLSATTGTTVIGNYKKYTITHTPASTQASEIKATNVNTAITFGSNFNIVNKIAYDANGHVVSGSTQTLTLPNLPTASEENNGIVKIRSGQLTLAAELLDETKGYLTTAASVAHGHTEYVKFTDLSSNSNSDSIIISCGTY